MTPIAEETRRSILDRLEQAVPPAIFQTWCRDLRIQSVAENVYEVPVPNAFYRDWLEREIRRPLEDAFRQVFGRAPELTFRIREEMEPLRLTAPESAAAPTPPPTRRTAEPGGLVLNPSYTFDTFVVGPTNRVAHAAALAVSEKQEAVPNPFFVHGGVGMGKTHLLQAVCHAILERNPHARILYLSCESFVNDYIGALQKGRIEEFRRRMRSAGVLAIDDVHFLAGKDSSQEEFFHTFNALHLAGRRILLSSDSGPREIRALKEQLVSRFLGGFEARIDPPTFEMRVAILLRKAELKGRELPADVVSYVASQVDTNIRELEGAVNKLIAYATLSGRSIDLDLAREALKEAALPPGSRVGIAKILETVARFYGKRVLDLRSRTWTKSTSRARQVAMFLCKELTPQSLTEIGSQLGGKDHSTVLYGIRRIAQTLPRDAQLRTEIATLRHLLNAGDGGS